MKLKLKIIIHIIIGFIISWLITQLIDRNSVPTLLLAIPILGIVHELLHWILIKIFGLEYKLIVNGLCIGFKTIFNNIKQLIIVAIVPQVITIILVFLYIVTINLYIIPLTILHLAISVEDIAKTLRYIYNYFT